jgi:predicted methyltransferase
MADRLIPPVFVEAHLRVRSAYASHTDADAEVGGHWSGWMGSFAVLSLLLAAAVTAAPTPPPTPSDRATATHSFADVPYWTKVFDDPKRDDWQKPREMVAALGLQPGQTVADLGAGTGYLSRYLADAVGPSGSVLAVEVEPTLVTHLRERAEQGGIDNLIPVLGSVDSARLPARGVDLIVILDTYHHLDHRHAYLPTLRAFLVPGGRVAVVDWRAGQLPEGPPPEHKLPRQQVIDEMRAAGFTLATEHEFLPYHYFLIFE